MRFKRVVNRIEPRHQVTEVKTYSVAAPPATHWRTATCIEVECKANAEGWLTVLDPNIHGAQLNYIRLHSGRSYAEVTDPLLRQEIGIPAGMVALWFAAGQKCFAEHRVPVWREPILIVRDGDWRGNPTGRSRSHVTRDNWVEDFAEHQDRVARQHERGSVA